MKEQHMQQTFLVEKEARVNLTKVRGDLEVRGWDKREISLDWEDRSGNLQQEGNLLMLANCSSDVEIWAPYDVEIRVEGLGGDVSAQDIRRIELKDVRGKVTLRNIGADANLEYIGEAVSLMEIGGDLEVQKASSLRARRKIGGDAKLQDIRLVEIEAVRADLELLQVDMASIGSVGADLKVSDVREALRCGNVGGDCQISGSAEAEINLGNVGGDLQIGGATRVHVGNSGGDAELRDVRESVHIGNIGSDGTLINVAGNLTVGQIGGDARLLGLGGSTRVGGIGGDLELQATFAPESKMHLHVGGDASVTLPMEANLSLQVTVGGTIRGSSITFERNGNLARLIYGEGVSQVNLSVGGDLQLRGGGTPHVSSASMPWGEFSQEMADLGQGMAQLGSDLGKEFMDIFSDMSRTSFSWTDDVGRKVEEQMRRARQKAEQHARQAGERARKAEERAWRHAREHGKRRADRTYVRINEREWQMNPERLNDLVNRAQEAAMDGVAGAMEAVERAVNNLRMQRPPYPGQPPMPPTPPTGGPVPPVPPAPPMPPMPPTGGAVPPIPPYPTMPTPPVGEPETAPVEQAESEADGPNLEAEREAILRMIAEGRITPEEGDMLLEGLGN
jgi:hypothetical protein